MDINLKSLLKKSRVLNKIILFTIFSVLIFSASFLFSAPKAEAASLVLKVNGSVGPITINSGDSITMSTDGSGLNPAVGTGGGNDTDNWSGKSFVCKNTIGYNLASFVLTNNTGAQISKTYSLKCFEISQFFDAPPIFSNTVTVNIKPAPTLILKANGSTEPITIKSGESVWLSTIGSGINSNISGIGGGTDTENWSGRQETCVVPTSFFHNINPPNRTNSIITKTYNLTCTKASGGTITSNTVIVNIKPQPAVFVGINGSNPTWDNPYPSIFIKNGDLITIFTKINGDVPNIIGTASGTDPVRWSGPKQCAPEIAFPSFVVNHPYPNTNSLNSYFYGITCPSLSPEQGNIGFGTWVWVYPKYFLSLKANGTAGTITVESGTQITLSTDGIELNTSKLGAASGTDPTNWSGTKTCSNVMGYSWAPSFVAVNNTGAQISKTYTLTCTKVGGGNISSTVTVKIKPIPTTLVLKANNSVGPITINSGDVVALSTTGSALDSSKLGTAGGTDTENWSGTRMCSNDPFLWLSFNLFNPSKTETRTLTYKLTCDKIGGGTITSNTVIININHEVDIECEITGTCTCQQLGNCPPPSSSLNLRVNGYTETSAVVESGEPFNLYSIGNQLMANTGVASGDWSGSGKACPSYILDTKSYGPFTVTNSSRNMLTKTYNFKCKNLAGEFINSNSVTVYVKPVVLGCENGAINYPECDDFGGCTNPPCGGGGGVCENGATNYSACTLGDTDGDGDQECLNGATNPALCTLDVNGDCLNGAVNPPLCTVDIDNQCLNGATNPALCTMKDMDGDGDEECINGLNNPPVCATKYIKYIEN
ncbi:MAG: hypothetical protein WC662_02955 [Candidatus Paceibacterota bacterium]|jgi:hypothetical protein